jgi:hypothetical protein
MTLPSRQTVLSIIRTVVYAAVVVVLALRRAEIKAPVDAVLAGAILGDYLTWLVWAVVELPENLLHGCYEAGVNLVFGMLFFRMGNINLSADITGELMAIGFLACLLTVGVKSFFIGMVFIEKEIEDDD